jgi:transcriptional regulator GlxA family with amidase domain
MSSIIIAASPATMMASLGAMADAHSRLSESFASNPALGDYATMQTQLFLVAAQGGDVSLAGGRSLPSDKSLGAIDDVRMIYLPSFQIADTTKLETVLNGAGRLHGWLAKQHGKGRLIGACGASVGHLAAAGLLDGATAAIHPRLVTSFRRLFPKVQVDTLNSVVETERLMTCGPDSAAADLVLRMFAVAHGPAVARGLRLREPVASGATAPSLSADPIVTEAKLWIQERFTQHVNIGELAAMLGVSHQTLLRRFRAAGEETPRVFATRLRIDAAASMLSDTARPVSEIAHLIGYSDIVAFRDMFVQYKGCSPSDYRRMKRAGTSAISKKTDDAVRHRH